MATSTQPTIFHITHWKAGSQWIYSVFRDLIPDRIIPPKGDQSQFTKDRIIPGGFYPTVYLPKNEFDTIVIPDNNVKFIIIRDLRDSLISYYFSMKTSHKLINEVVKELRDKLNSLSKEDSLMFLIEKIYDFSRIQRSWISTNELIIKYEDLIYNETTLFMKLFRHCKINLPGNKLKKTILNNSFSIKTRGRELGVEDVNQHLRKGIPGDGKNHFSDKVKEAFKESYGDLLIETGYESNFDW
jgi:lipopolysaccharide transport system ATP-binding protein